VGRTAGRAQPPPPPRPPPPPTQTLSVQESPDGTNFTTLVSAGYTFHPATQHTVTINLTAATTTRYTYA